MTTALMYPLIYYVEAARSQIGACRPDDPDDADFWDGLTEAATQLRTAAAEGGTERAKPWAHLVMTEWNSIAWWTTDSAERAQQEADELMRYDSNRKLTVVSVYLHPPTDSGSAEGGVRLAAVLRDVRWRISDTRETLMADRICGEGKLYGCDEWSTPTVNLQRAIVVIDKAIGEAE